MERNQWDTDINEQLLSQDDLREFRLREHLTYLREQEERRRENTFELPALSAESIRADFPFYLEHPDRSPDEYYGPNRVFWVCLNCGGFGYKSNPEHISELFKCNRWDCKSRNVRILRAGEIANLLRNSSVGTDMNMIYQARRVRFREARRARRQNAASN